ncbi:MAG: hypothetical protein AAFQ68_20340 [Bacteroidota bacterium]
MIFITDWKPDNLFFVGGIEISSAIFGLLNLQGEMLAAYLQAQQADSHAYTDFLWRKHHKALNLQGKNHYIDSQRHQRYVNKTLYRKLLNGQIQALRHEKTPRKAVRL